MHGELLTLALVFGAALFGGRTATKLGYPSILGELAAGILLGPPLLGLLNGSEALSILGETGVLLMMLYIGMHLDLGDLARASRPGLMAALGGFLVPAALGLGLMLLLEYSGLEALFVGLAMGVTSLATKSRILSDLRILDTRVAYVLMAAALVSDLIVLVVFAAVIGPEGAASGTTITFPGYRAVYVAADDSDSSKEALLPPLAQGGVVAIESLEPSGHTTSPPARYTEASLVKRLEELEIGRPSTWASIIQTVQDRGYVWKKGQALVPTWTAFAVGSTSVTTTRCRGSGRSSRRTSTRSTRPRSTRSRSATTRTASWSSPSRVSTAHTSNGATTPRACPTI